jgi:1-deoxy-D-xylulose-5-phosphate synthase
MSYLENINYPEDLKKLKVSELDSLCAELREFLIKSVSKTGGHLASNLGVVELTVALHYCFDAPKDKLIWDVGHQTYIHKILTGRKGRMDSLRQMGGLSGFPKRAESKYDVFDTGHSSTSLSAAVGMARARDIKKENYEIISVIGDGAMTGGMAFEALNDAGRSNTKLIIILNDNEMSISHNVGGLSKYLSGLRTEPSYISTKKDVERLLDNMPLAGKKLKRFIKKVKDGIKQMVVPGMLFEDLGLTYIGPVNGHDINELLEALNRAKKLEGPILVHVLTKKGKGYRFAEEKPHKFHGVSPFDIETGENISKSEESFSDVFGDELCRLAEDNDKVIAVTAAMTEGTGLKKFALKFPKRIFDVGIAEQHAVTMAAGLSVNGMVPVVAVYSSFLQRAIDQVIHDVATQNLHVVFAVDRAGIVGKDGETHQGIFDSGILCQIPNMTVMVPADFRELKMMLDYAVNEFYGPVAVRYPRGSSEKSIPGSDKKIIFGKGNVAVAGDDLTIIAGGKMLETALKVRDILGNSKNLHAEVINLRFFKPLDDKIILDSVNKTGKAVIIEETAECGSIAYKIKSMLPDGTKVMIKTLPDSYIRHGSVEELLKQNGLDAETIAEEIIRNLIAT